MKKPTTYSTPCAGDMSEDPQGDWIHIDDIQDHIECRLDADTVSEWLGAQLDEAVIDDSLSAIPITLLARVLAKALESAPSLDREEALAEIRQAVGV
jgi:hypothetical protein